MVLHAGVRLRQEVTRATFEELTRDLLERTQATTELVVKQAGLGFGDIDRVLLVGGSTRMPMVARVLRELTGKEPDQSQSADEVVAHGAALYAAMLCDLNAADRPQFELVNVNSHSLGVVGTDPELGRKVNVVLIPKNTPLPARKVKQFRTAQANQRSVKVRVIEGESQRPEYCISLGECIVRDLPPGLPAGTRWRWNIATRPTVRSPFMPVWPARGNRHLSRSIAMAGDSLKIWKAGGGCLPSEEGYPARGLK